MILTWILIMILVVVVVARGLVSSQPVINEQLNSIRTGLADWLRIKRVYTQYLFSVFGSSYEKIKRLAAVPPPPPSLSGSDPANHIHTYIHPSDNSNRIR